jgi:hypothetical protein
MLMPWLIYGIVSQTVGRDPTGAQELPRVTKNYIKYSCNHRTIDSFGRSVRFSIGAFGKYISAAGKAFHKFSLAVHQILF